MSCCKLHKHNSDLWDKVAFCGSAYTWLYFEDRVETLLKKISNEGIHRNYFSTKNTF